MKTVLNDYRAYLFGENDFFDTVDITLPELAFMTATLGGAGILGEVEMSITAQLQAMTVGINFHNFGQKELSLMNGIKHLEFRGSEQYIDVASGEIKDRAVKVVIKSIPKKFGLGTLAKASEIESNYEGECTYLKIEHDGKIVSEVDKFNYICTIDGVDLLANIRANIGL